MAYQFYFDGNEIPITPGSVTITTSGNNKTVTLIDQGEINILKLPKLKEIKFDVLLPTREYPFANTSDTTPSTWLDVFEAYKQDRTPFQFVITRTTDFGESYHGTSLRCSIEDYEEQEDAEEYGTDVNVSVTLKEYKEYGTKTVVITSQSAATVSAREQDNAPTTPATIDADKADNPVALAKLAHNTSTTAPGVAADNNYGRTPYKLADGLSDKGYDLSYQNPKVTIPTRDAVESRANNAATTSSGNTNYSNSVLAASNLLPSKRPNVEGLCKKSIAQKADDDLKKMLSGVTK